MERPRLRGNTFIALLLRAGVQELSEKSVWGQTSNDITRPNMFADLLRMTQPSYTPPKIKTLSSYFSQYLSGEKPFSQMYYAFNTPPYQHGLAMRIQSEYPAVLAEMDSFYHKYLRNSEPDRRLLVAGLVDAVLADDTFFGSFDIGNKKVEKNALGYETHFVLQPFLISIWANILENHPDTSEGIETYLTWTEEIAQSKPREITTQIGAERAKKIAVSDVLPEEGEPDTAEEFVPVDAEEVQDEPHVEDYETSFVDPFTHRQVVAQIHAEARDNGIAAGIVYGGINLGDRRRKKDE